MSNLTPQNSPEDDPLADLFTSERNAAGSEQPVPMSRREARQRREAAAAASTPADQGDPADAADRETAQASGEATPSATASEAAPSDPSAPVPTTPLGPLPSKPSDASPAIPESPEPSAPTTVPVHPESSEASSLAEEPSPKPARTTTIPAFEDLLLEDDSADDAGAQPIHRGRRRALAGGEPPKRRRGRRGLIALIVSIVVVGGLVACAAVVWTSYEPQIRKVLGWEEPNDFEGAGSGEVVVMINEGDIGEDIATNLHDAGVTKSFDAFYDLLLAQPTQPEFFPGAYKLKLKMSADSALAALTDEANRMEDTFVIPEGTAEQDALPSIAEGTGIPLEELQAAAADVASFGLPAEATSLEGFLFPATYSLPDGGDAHAVLQTLVNRSFQALDDAGVKPEDRWKTIVLASLIQKEAGLRDDYYKVSRVFLNRLDPSQWESGLLQSDATVAYGTGNTHRVSTTDAEREDASNPYNTYVHPGMVVRPISNPGDLAIDAALHPADGPWLYFVTWNLDSGETIFSTTQEEHEAAVAKWLSWMDEHPEYQ
ncbi:endolytic transglycosylase MltG [Plantibacter sp. LMC-P-059a]|uniref:endolytic transglycosylase MltG n=1 Tax=Plantibacter sp. LMC-P-059a TaxID=3040297 RepID=UPI00254A9FC3|nr:endolytic transglycosylase MltG [Plantibacter sp. LMC-P-059a]